MFHEPAIQSELSQDNVDTAAATDNIDNIGDNAHHHIVDDEEEEDTEAELVASGDDDHVVETSPDDIVATAAQRQHSTTEYLPGMLHSNSPPGLLPKFPSWSLLQLGDYSSYNPSTGDNVGIVVGAVA